jgi:hypothetical protein
MSDGFDPAALSMRDLRRLTGELWTDPRCDGIATAVLDAAVAADAKSLDRTLLTAYLRHFPGSHPAFEQLRAASELTAARRDWPWRARGETWQLWDGGAGPERVAAALLKADDPASVLREAGLDGDLAQGAFVGDAIGVACELAAAAKGNAAQVLGGRLITLFEGLAIAGHDAMLAWALLVPWLDRTPAKAHRARIAKLLVKRLGDPRLNPARWEAIAAEMRDPDALSLVALLRRWLTDATVREFFKIVTHTTNDVAQWQEREAFWLGYLDAGLIDEAWFALGVNADQLIRRRPDRTEMDYGLITGERQYADPSHSSLILSVGRLRIAEWSHSGACRFWDASDRTAPIPYRKQYFGLQLRAMNGGPEFEYLSHWSGWQRNFATKVKTMTGRAHPDN